MKKVLFIGAGVAAAYIVVELLSFVVLAGINEVKPNTFALPLEEYFAELDDEYLRTYLQGDYHPLLGWDHLPGSENTSKTCLGGNWTESFDSDTGRSTPVEFDTYILSSYGDSYVKGGEVNNDQTWQFQLAKKLDAGVKNYAVGAFDPYQALLKIKLHIEQGNVYPVTILGINEQNIQRVVNLFRPFVYRKVGAKLSFKPGLSCSDGKCVEVPNLLRPDVQTIDEVKAIAREARRLDYWVRRKPVLEYSWLANLIKLTRLAASVGYATEGEPLWQTPDGHAAMHLIVSEFQELLATTDSIPVVLFIPTKPNKGIPASYEGFKRQIMVRYPDLIVLDVMDREFDAERFKLKPTGECHPSEYGHSVIADTVREGLTGVLQERAINASAARK